MKYKLRRSVGVEADVVCTELERIAEEHGAITPAVVVEEARPQGAPLHAAFTWDNATAAEQYRLIEARNLIRAVHVVANDGTDQGCAYVHVNAHALEDETVGAYLPVAQVVESPDLFALAVRGLASKLDQAQRALADLEKQARSTGSRKRAAHVSRARKATETASKELGAIT